ncbi:hypothetical protein EVAR_28975_1 [Eumeta japonica]|uniref:Uncharacterized protein n=1 Tax=Eumeta variegata TaxID=151549 RepID=A0A4C1W1P6_EUMVA|nr:hypothetical protein EVAR_28975_1 [Eumeta japonica]
MTDVKEEFWCSIQELDGVAWDALPLMDRRSSKRPESLLITLASDLRCALKRMFCITRTPRRSDSVRLRSSTEEWPQMNCKDVILYLCRIRRRVKKISYWIKYL